jgi:hypothetical protein
LDDVRMRLFGDPGGSVGRGVVDDDYLKWLAHFKRRRIDSRKGSA